MIANPNGLRSRPTSYHLQKIEIILTNQFCEWIGYKICHARTRRTDLSSHIQPEGRPRAPSPVVTIRLAFSSPAAHHDSIGIKAVASETKNSLKSGSASKTFMSAGSVGNESPVTTAISKDSSGVGREMTDVP